MDSTYVHGEVSNKMKTCRVSPLAFTAILSLPSTLSPDSPCIEAGNALSTTQWRNLDAANARLLWWGGEAEMDIDGRFSVA